MIVLAFDTETTGLIDNLLIPLERQPEVIEWAHMLVDLDKCDILDEWQTLIRPRLRTHKLNEIVGKEKKSITQMTGITDEMVANAPYFADVAERIIQAIDGAPAVLAHNASFDCDMINIELQRLQAEVRWPERICTIEQSNHYFGRRASLSELHQHLLGTPHEDAHRAMPDVQALVMIATEMRVKGDL